MPASNNIVGNIGSFGKSGCLFDWRLRIELSSIPWPWSLQKLYWWHFTSVHYTRYEIVILAFNY